MGRGQGDPLHPLVPKDPSIPVNPVSPVKGTGLSSPRGTVSSLGFPSSNGVSAEALFAFHDFIFVFLLPILVGVFSYILILLIRIPSFRLLLDCQPVEFFLALPSLSLLYLLDEAGLPCATSKVVGHQWYWSYEQSDLDFSAQDSYLKPGPLRLLNTDSSLIVYNSIVLRLLISSADVLHS